MNNKFENLAQETIEDAVKFAKDIILFQNGFRQVDGEQIFNICKLIILIFEVDMNAAIRLVKLAVMPVNEESK